MAELARMLAPSGHTLTSGPFKAPRLYSGDSELKPYQQVALEWLLSMHDKGLSPILADESGLGKIVVVIAMLAALASDRGEWGPHLVLAPEGLCSYWEVQLRRLLPGLRVMRLSAAARDRRRVCGELVRGAVACVCVAGHQAIGEDAVGALERVDWGCVVFDDADPLFACRSAAARRLSRLRARGRVALLRSPLEPRPVSSLWRALLALVPQGVTSGRAGLRTLRSLLLQPGAGAVTDAVRGLMQASVLRRTRADVVEQLPALVERSLACPLSSLQAALCSDIVSTRTQSLGDSDQGLLAIACTSSLLRQAQLHPELVLGEPAAGPFRCPSVVAATDLRQLLRTASAAAAGLLRASPRSLDFALTELEGVARRDAALLQPPKSLIVELGTATAAEDAAAAAAAALPATAGWRSRLEAEERSAAAAAAAGQLRVCRARCAAAPVYGADVLRRVSIARGDGGWDSLSTDPGGWCGALRQLTLALADVCILRRTGSAEEPSAGDALAQCRVAAPRAVVALPPAAGGWLLPAAMAAETVGGPKPRSGPWAVRRGYLGPGGAGLKQSGRLAALAATLRGLQEEGRRAAVFVPSRRAGDMVEELALEHGLRCVRQESARRPGRQVGLVARFNGAAGPGVFVCPSRAGKLAVLGLQADAAVVLQPDPVPAVAAALLGLCAGLAAARPLEVLRLTDSAPLAPAPADLAGYPGLESVAAAAAGDGRPVGVGEREWSAAVSLVEDDADAAELLAWRSTRAAAVAAAAEAPTRGGWGAGSARRSGRAVVAGDSEAARAEGRSGGLSAADPWERGAVGLRPAVAEQLTAVQRCGMCV